MRDDVIVVFGGSGFLGTHVVRELAKADKRIRVAMRRPHLGGDLRVLGRVGQVQLVQANVRFPDSIAAALEGADGVVNLVGTLHDRGKQNFQALHVDAARTIAEAAAARGLRRLVQVSALGAAPKGSRYAKTKFAGEEAVTETLPDATILRPSVMFGSEDTFFNRFAEMARFAATVPLGALPLIGAKTRFQPVFVADVAEAVRAALDEPRARGRVFELGGPAVYTMRQIMEYVTAETERRVPLVSLPFVAALPLGLLLEWSFKLSPFGEAPLTGDQVTMLQRNNIVSPGASTFADLGITHLESVEAIVPSYLWRFRPYGQFQTNQTA